MKYTEFYEGYPWGGFSATKSDFAPTPHADDDDEIAIRGVRVSDFVEEDTDGPCWDGYEMVGHKMKDGKKVPNCVPVKEERSASDHDDELNEGEYCPRCLATEIVRARGASLQEAEYQGRKVPLGKPMRGDVAKFKVYVKDPKTGNVKKVNFGDKTMKIKKSNPARRKSFRARHKCHTAKDRTTARYWSCKAW